MVPLSFLKHCGPERPQVLVLDSHSSHEVLALLECAKKENIHLMALPPHTTHWLQPLNRAVNGPLKSRYNRLCTEFMSEGPNNIINHQTWPGIFAAAWKDRVTYENICSGFRGSGLYPVDMSNIPEQAFYPSEAASSAPSEAATPQVHRPVLTDISTTAPRVPTVIMVPREQGADVQTPPVLASTSKAQSDAVIDVDCIENIPPHNIIDLGVPSWGNTLTAEFGLQLGAR